MPLYSERCSRVQRRLRERSAAGAIVSPGPNLQYVTGFRGEPVDRFHALFVPADGDVTLVTPAGYETQARRNATADAIQTVPDNDPAQVADEVISRLPADPESVLVDDDARHAFTRHLHAAFGSETIEPVAPILQSMRRRKDDHEIETLRRAAVLADEVSVDVRSLGADAVGMTEADLATEIRRGLHARGATGVAFDVVVGAGENGADPALRHSDREIQAGEPVVVDFGCFLDGYASDQTRTVVFDGQPPAGFEAVHNAVVDALDAGVAAVEPGITAGGVDAAVRDRLAEDGYADKFVHDTGHGVGLAAHEPLAIAPDESTELASGMVFSVEPGVYFEDEFGVRVEDLVVVTEDGCERLNDSPRTWRSL